MKFKFIPRGIYGDIGAYRRDNVIYINLLSAFTSSTASQTAYDLILSATEEDTIELTLSTPGGSVYVLDSITALLKASPAKVKMYVARLTASCGGFILAFADELYVAPNAEIMFHNASTSVYAMQVNVLTSYVEGTKHWASEQVEILVEKKFLTEAEAKQIRTNNKDIVLLGEDLIERGVAKPYDMGELENVG